MRDSSGNPFMRLVAEKKIETDSATEPDGYRGCGGHAQNKIRK